MVLLPASATMGRVMTRNAIAPIGYWPRRMGSNLPARHVGKSAVEAVLWVIAARNRQLFEPHD